MKRLFIIVFLFCLGVASCHYEKPEFYEEGDYIQFYYSNLINKDTNDRKTAPLNYPYVNSNRLRDTAWFRLQAVGMPAKKDRIVRFEPYINKADSNYITAVPGVNYVAFDDPDIQRHMIIPAEAVYMNIPVVILYDAETKGSVALNFQLVPTNDFELGELTLRKGRYSYSNY